MPTLIKLKRSETGNDLTPQQKAKELERGEPFVDLKSKALIIGARKEGTKDTIGDHYDSETDEWVDTYQPLYRSDEKAVTVGNSKGRISVGAMDYEAEDGKGTKIYIKDNLPVDINGVILHSLSSSSGGSPDYGDRYSFIGCSDETPNTAIFSKGTVGNSLGIMSITNTTSNFRNFTRLRMHQDHSVSLTAYINGDTPTNPDKNFTISGLNTVQESGYIQVGSSVNATRITNDDISTRKLNGSSILGVGSSSNPVYINSSGQFQACALYYQIIECSYYVDNSNCGVFSIGLFSGSGSYAPNSLYGGFVVSGRFISSGNGFTVVSGEYESASSRWVLRGCSSDGLPGSVYVPDANVEHITSNDVIKRIF